MLQPPGGRPWLLYALLGASLGLNLYMALQWPPPPQDCTEPAAEAAPPGAPTVQPEPARAVPDQAAAVQAVRDASPATGEGAASSILDPLPADEPDYEPVRVELRSSVAQAFHDALGPEGDAVAAVYARIFTWDLDLRHDLRRGDTVTTLYRLDGDEVDIPVAWYQSSKLGRTLKAYRYRARGDRYPSYWYPDGREAALRLEHSPIEDYVQITARLDDRVNHHGYDFKAEVGTPVVAPWAATVTRTNWNTRMNGNCVELRFDDGVTAKYLHLSRVDVRPGQRLAAGARVGAVGNTGRSTAAHLHYQLERGRRVLDPADYHGTYRRQLPADELPAFQQEVARLDMLLAQEVAER